MQSSSPQSSLTPSLDTGSGHDLGNSDSDESDADVTQSNEPEIDEHSDDEDDRAAHEFLHAAPTATNLPTPSPEILPYNHQGFSVRSSIC